MSNSQSCEEVSTSNSAMDGSAHKDLKTHRENPWRFNVDVLELQFMDDFISSSVDRLKPILSMIVPIGWTLRLLDIILLFVRDEAMRLSPMSICLVIGRLIFTTFASFLVLRAPSLSKEMKRSVGKVVVWFNRAHVALTAINEAGVRQHDDDAMLMLVGILFSGFLSISTFEEVMVPYFEYDD